MDCITEPRKDSRLHLPTELLLHIKDQFEPDDLLGHLCFYKLSPERKVVIRSTAPGQTSGSHLCAQTGWVCRYSTQGRRRLAIHGEMLPLSVPSTRGCVFILRVERIY